MNERERENKREDETERENENERTNERKREGKRGRFLSKLVFLYQETLWVIKLVRLRLT